MKNKIIVLSVLLISIFLTVNVEANRIVIPGYTGVGYYGPIFETDKINDKDLHVDLVFSFFVPANVENYTNNVSVTLSPVEFTNSPEATVYDINVCEGHLTGGGPDGPTFTCNKTIPYSKTKSGSDYVITIDIKNRTEYNPYLIHMSYLLPDFIFQEGRNYIATFNSYCSPDIDNTCANRWSKTIILPYESSVIQDLSGNIKIWGRTDLSNGKWVLSMQGQGPTFVRYYDSNEVDFRNPFLIGMLGGITSIVVVEIIRRFMRYLNLF